MQPYGNVDGNSGVTAYEYGVDWIHVQFRSDGTYEYNYAVPGAIHVEQMKEHAQAGRGLATYINRHVRDDYARRIG